MRVKHFPDIIFDLFAKYPFEAIESKFRLDSIRFGEMNCDERQRCVRQQSCVKNYLSHMHNGRMRAVLNELMKKKFI